MMLYILACIVTSLIIDELELSWSLHGTEASCDTHKPHSNAFYNSSFWSLTVHKHNWWMLPCPMTHDLKWKVKRLCWPYFWWVLI